MTAFIRFPLSLCLICCVVLSHPVFAQTATNSIVAIVNDSVITESQVDELMQMTQSLNPVQNNQRVQSRHAALNHLVDQELLKQGAMQLGIVLSEKELDEALNDQTTQEMYIQPLKAANIAPSKIREGVAYELQKGKLLSYFASKVTVSEEEIQLKLKQAPILKTPSEPVQYYIEDLLIPSKNKTSSIETARRQTEEAYETAKTGVSLDQLAKRQKQWSFNDLGWRQQDTLPALFLDEIKEMKVGEVSKPLKAPNGFHLIRLVKEKGRNQDKKVIRVRHILIRPMSSVNEQDLVKRLSAIREHAVKRGDFKQQAMKYSEDPQSALAGGDLGWTVPESLDERFLEAVQGLALNEISAPFKTKSGWHIAQFLGQKVVDSNPNLPQFKYKWAKSEIYQTKVKEALNNWLEEFRNQAYIKWMNSESEE